MLTFEWCPIDPDCSLNCKCGNRVFKDKHGEIPPHGFLVEDGVLASETRLITQVQVVETLRIAQCGLLDVTQEEVAGVLETIRKGKMILRIHPADGFTNPQSVSAMIISRGACVIGAQARWPEARATIRFAQRRKAGIHHKPKIHRGLEPFSASFVAKRGRSPLGKR